MTVMIPRNTTIPTQKKETYSTAADNQTSVEIHILQGERAQASQNRTLGKFHLEGLPTAPRGIPKIEVTFDIDANGILAVMAKDTATGKDQKITITASSGLSEDEVSRMVKDAELNEAEDKKRREEVERRNKLDNLCYQLEKQIADNKDKLDPADVTTLESLIRDGRDAVEKQDDEKVKRISEELEKKAHELASKLYSAAGPEAGAAAGAGAAGAGDAKSDVIDAEFEESN
jgi:molecular chaperone DnaK